MAAPTDSTAQLAAVRAAIAAAVSGIEEEPDRRSAIRLADNLRACLAEAAEDAAALRGDIALRLRTEERLPLADLAEILGGVSTTRASQILAAAQARNRQTHLPEAQDVQSSDISPAIAALRHAYAEAEAAIEVADSAQDAVRQATALREAADDLVRRAADLRARMARRLRDEEDLSVAALAARLGISKARADQLLRTAGTNDH